MAITHPLATRQLCRSVAASLHAQLLGGKPPPLLRAEPSLSSSTPSPPEKWVGTMCVLCIERTPLDVHKSTTCRGTVLRLYTSEACENTAETLRKLTNRHAVVALCMWCRVMLTRVAHHAGSVCDCRRQGICGKVKTHPPPPLPTRIVRGVTDTDVHDYQRFCDL